MSGYSMSDVPGLHGREVRLRPRGPGRFFGAGFLLFWLCGWAVGETFALWILVRGASALVTGEPVNPGDGPLQIGPAAAVAAFLLVWLTFWTLGGLAAMREVLKLLWSEDRVSSGSGALVICRRLGPFRSRRTIPRDELQAVSILPRTGALLAETASGTIEVSVLGTREERERLADALRAELLLDQEVGTAFPQSVPSGWREIADCEGYPALVRDPRTRRVQARVLAVVALAAGSVAFLLVRETVSDLSLLPLAAMAVTAALGLGWGASWLARGRMEWRIGSGSLLLRRRHGSRVRDVFEARTLELGVRRDNDGDEWFELEAVAPERPESASAAGRKGRRTITRAMNDPREPRGLGLWLARRAALPFQDRTGGDHRSVDLARLEAELPQAGALGRLAARLIEKAERRRDPV